MLIVWLQDVAIREFEDSFHSRPDMHAARARSHVFMLLIFRFSFASTGMVQDRHINSYLSIVNKLYSKCSDLPVQILLPFCELQNW